ncbi:MAG: DUF2818 family protein [Gammaproteobacteria bacterium]
MDASSAAWLLIAVALAAANLPFANERLFGVIPLSGARAGSRKSGWLRVLELLVLYFAVGGIAHLLESRSWCCPSPALSCATCESRFDSEPTAPLLTFTRRTWSANPTPS